RAHLSGQTPAEPDEDKQEYGDQKIAYEENDAANAHWENIDQQGYADMVKLTNGDAGADHGYCNHHETGRFGWPRHGHWNNEAEEHSQEHRGEHASDDQDS